MNPGGERLPSADGLRAAAALMVVAFHAVAVVGPLWLTGSARRGVWQLGPLGVAVFFVLSGMLMYRPYVAASLEGGAAPPLGPYALRRAARILPGLWFALLGAVVLMNDQFAKASVVLLQALLLQNYRFGYALTGLGVAWTLVIECAFYAVLPLIGFVAIRGCSRATTVRARVSVHLGIVGALVVGAVAWRWFFSIVHEPGSRQAGTWFSGESALLWLPAYLDLFALGMLFAVAAHPASQLDARLRGLRALGRRPAVALIAAGVFFGLLVPLHLGGVGNAPSIAGHAFVAAMLRAVAAALLVLPVGIAATSLSTYHRFLASSRMVWLGAISYGIYLWHLTMLHVGKEIVGPVHDRPVVAFLFLAGAIGATVAVAWFSWRFVEHPAMAFAARLAYRVPDRRT